MRLPIQAGPIALIYEHRVRKSTSPQALNWGGSGSGSCVDRCLASCPKDTIGGIEVACALNCFWICSGSRVSGYASLAATY
jgi:hypothetical protein